MICEKVVRSSVLSLASSDDHTLMKGTIVGERENGAASSDVTTIASGTREIKGVCEEQTKFSVLARAVPVVLVQARPICVERKRGERWLWHAHVKLRASVFCT